ncbi:MAG: hypothetical protein WBS22_13695 [Methylocystis sp.]
MRLSVSTLGGIVLAGAAALASSATAATVTFDFGLLGGASSAPSSASPCGSECVIPINGEVFFTKSGVSVGAIGYNPGVALTNGGSAPSGSPTYVTQKPGAFGGSGETGIGESNTSPHPSDADYEITTKTALVLDNTLANAGGYKSATLSIESMQLGEGANIFTWDGNSADPLVLIKTFVGGNAADEVTQTTDVPYSPYFVVQAVDQGSAAANIVLAQEVLSTTPSAPNPEPSAWAAMLLIFARLGYARLRGQA